MDRYKRHDSRSIDESDEHRQIDPDNDEWRVRFESHTRVTNDKGEESFGKKSSERRQMNLPSRTESTTTTLTMRVAMVMRLIPRCGDDR